MPNYKSKLSFYIFLLIAAPLIILGLYFIINTYGTTIVTTNPQHEAQDVSTTDNIQIIFNHPIDEKSFKANLTPSFQYDFKYFNDEHKVILYPLFPLTPNTTYKIVITDPAKYSFEFKTQNIQDITGQSNEYREGVVRNNQQEEAMIKKDAAIIKMRRLLPITKPTFSLRYVIDSNTYVVKLSGDQVAKNDFLNWLALQEVSPTDIKIIYTDSSKADFTITSTNLSGQTISVVEPIKLTFTDPVKIETLNLSLTPNTPVLYSFSNDLTQIIISPVDTWQANIEYKLTLKGSIQSRDNKPLTQDYTYTFIPQTHEGI